MLYNVYINNGIAIKVTEYNSNCTQCNQMGSIPSEEVRVLKIDMPFGYHKQGDKMETIKKYINLNHII